MKTDTRQYYHSSSFKMAALFTLLLGISAILLGYFLYDFSRQNITRETEAAIDSEMAHLLSVMTDQSPKAIADYIEQRAAAEYSLHLYVSPDGKILAGPLVALPSNIELMKEGIIRFAVEIDEKKRLFAAKIHTLSDGYRLLIGRDIHDILQRYEKLKWVSGFILFFMLVVVCVSFLISGFVVSRINRIARTASDIMETGDLSRRIEVNSHWDDLSYLAQILNALLARIELLMEGIRDVSDSIAHDLRTPLTRLRNQLESARQAPLSDSDIQRLLAEADQLLATFHSLLRIANIEKGTRNRPFSPVNLVAIMQDVVELYEPLADDKHVSVLFSHSAIQPVMGDRDLLFQLMANLMDNAVKFSPNGGRIQVDLTAESNHVCLRIADEGPGIAETEYEKVFQRFYRADKSRHTPGNGLGLSLVKATLELHHASIELQDNQPGLRVIIRF